MNVTKLVLSSEQVAAIAEAIQGSRPGLFEVETTTLHNGMTVCLRALDPNARALEEWLVRRDGYITIFPPLGGTR